MDNHAALSIWCNLYRNGVRVTLNGNAFAFHAVDWLRIHKTKRFGLIEVEPCESSPEVIQTVQANAAELVRLLSQKPPQELIDWWFHPLELQYEARPLAVMAAKLGVAVYLEPCSLGMWPVALPNLKPESMTYSLPELKPILTRAGYAYHREAYRRL